MKQILFFTLCSIMSSALYALSCPNSSALLDVGDSMASVLAACGQPVSRKEYQQQRTTSQAVSPPAFVFAPNTSVNIHTPNQSIYSSQPSQAPVPLCATVTYTGATVIKNYYACQNPPVYNVPVSNTVTVTEWTYDTFSPNSLIFENGKLTGWK